MTELTPPREYAQDRPEIGISHPGHVDIDERQHGYRSAIAIAWRAIQHARTAEECRARLVELGQAPAPDLSGTPRRTGSATTEEH